MVVVYAVMLGATMLGQLLGIAAASALAGRGGVALPLAASVVLEAVAGARLGARRSGGTLTVRQAWKISATYSGALVAITVPLAVWIEVAARANGGTSSGMGPVVALAFYAVLGTLARWGLMTRFAPRPRA